jgi:uncharacterized protein (TIGR02145 family)
MYKIILSLFIVGFSLIINAQSVGIGTTTPASSAQLDVNSTTQGLLPPRMSYAQRNAIITPATGLIIYCTDCANGEMQYYNGTSWISMSVGAGAIPANLPSVQICNQIWTTQNLNVSTYADGTVIPQVQDATAWASLSTGAWCYYANDAINGKVYNWYAVAGIYDAASFNNPLLRKKLAPDGWHMPTNYEWNKLVKCIDPLADTTTCCTNSAGIAMKSTTGWNNNGLNSGTGTNRSGFAGVPGGYRNYDGAFYAFGINGVWWSSTENSTMTSGLNRILAYNSSDVKRQTSNKSNGNPVRCIRD